MKTRIIVGGSLLAALALSCWIDTALLERAVVSSCLIVLLGMAALREWNRFFPGGGTYPLVLYAAGLAYPLLEGGRILLAWNAPRFDSLFLAGLPALLFLRAILAGDVEDGLDRVARTFLGFMVVWLFYRMVPLLLESGRGGGLAAAYGLVFTAKACDIGAYFSGSLIGGPRLVPRVSPKKTVAGAAGGLFLSTAAGMAAASFIGGKAFPFGAVFGFAVGLAAMFGDLAESLVKRCAGVKDSGDLLPGQGGILDLIDSLILAAPAGYVLLVLF